MECPKCHAENREDSRFCSNCAAPLGPRAGAGPEAASLTRTLETPVRILKTGSLIAGKYKIINEVGRGGMGVVYKAEDIKLKRSVALKFLPPHLMDSPELKERFLIEAQAAAALSHPNICVIYEVGEAEDRPFIAMEYVEGETLRDWIKKGPLKTDEALDIVTQVAAGLGAAHHKGIVHRDIKSANIMVTEQGQAKVMDFGLAKLRGGSSLTKSQTTVGTIAYMSPEQARGDDLDQRTDIWSLGVVLYELLSGELPFQGDHDQTLIYSILHKEPESLIKIRPALAPELDHVVFQALSKKRADRYQTMEEFRKDLAAIAEGIKPLKAKARPAAVKLAVLPFSNLTGDPDQEYLSDGLTQEMVTLLGRLHPQSLSVIARTSVMRYKKTDTPIDQIGRDLGVDYVLEGSARREGSRLRVSAELIQVRDQTQLWGDVFEREMSSILALQNDVAGEVAKALALKLLPSEQARLAKARPVNPEAHDAYLRAYHHWTQLTPREIDIAEKYVDLALEKDPFYAPAYVGRAWVWGARNQMGLASPEEAGPKAIAAALRAVELDANSAVAHEVLAVIRTWVDWDWAGAEPEWRRALELNPNAADTHAIYSHFLANVGRLDEAVPHIKLALELDPFNVLFHSFYASVLMYSRRYDDALAAARTALAMQPDAPVALTNLEEALFAKEMRNEQLALQRERVADDPGAVAAFEQGLAEAGYEGAQRRLADFMAARYEQSGRVMAVEIAIKYICAGDKARAIDWLEKAYEDRDPNLPYLGKPVWDSVRDDPRFQDLLRRMNLPLNTK